MEKYYRDYLQVLLVGLSLGKVFQICTVRYNWPMSAHVSQAFSIAHCTDSEDLPRLGLGSDLGLGSVSVIGLVSGSASASTFYTFDI